MIGTSTWIRDAIELLEVSKNMPLYMLKAESLYAIYAMYAIDGVA